MAIWAHVDPIIVTLTIDGEIIETTPEHPFYTDEGEWIAADELQPGDEIRTSAWLTVQGVGYMATDPLIDGSYEYWFGDYSPSVGPVNVTVINNSPVDESLNLRTPVPPTGTPRSPW